MKQQSKLNPNQEGAVLHKDGACLVLAGPGSGKTFVITERIRYLIETCHVDPQTILVITFTTKAACELKRRAVQKCEQSQYVNFGTFHSCFFQILRSQEAYRDIHLASERDKSNILIKILYANKIKDGQVNYELCQKLLKEFSKCKNMGCGAKQFDSSILENEQFCKIFWAYNHELHAEEMIDFDDMLVLCYDFLKKNPQICKRYKEQFQYMMIDEFQDTNAVQYAVVKLLTGEKKNLFVVGDDDQAIYGFRGSNPAFMRRFLEEFEDCKQILLDVNYRCDEEIVSLASKCIENNKNRFEKHIKANRKAGMAINQLQFDEELAEANYIVEKCKHFQEKEESTAILFRTNKDSRMIYQQLLLHGVDVNITERQAPFWERAEIQDLLAFLRFLCTKSRQDFLQFMNKPVRYIHRAAVSKEFVEETDLLAFYFDKKRMQNRVRELFRDIRFLEGADPKMACLYFRKKMGYDAFLQEKSRDKEKLQEQYDALDELQNLLAAYPAVEPFLKDYEKKDEQTQEKEEKKDNQSSISIMTYHASKGLEFEHVFLPKLKKGLVPSKRATTNDEIEEERRMFYVAMTRAIHTLDLSYAGEDNEESMFLKELTRTSI